MNAALQKEGTAAEGTDHREWMVALDLKKNPHVWENMKADAALGWVTVSKGRGKETVSLTGWTNRRTPKGSQ